MKNCRMIAAVLSAALAVMVAAAAAWAGGRGTSMLSLGLGQGTADGYAAAGNYLAPSSSPETNVNAEYWYAFSDDYAVAVSGAYGFGKMKWQSGVAGDPDIEATTSSYKFRIGGDRIGKVGERFKVFLGPGVEYWSGTSKVKVASSENESERVKRFGVSGRIGGFMDLTSSLSIMGQVGHTFGYASVDDTGAKTTWWPSSFEASWGLTFGFGGAN